MLAGWRLALSVGLAGVRAAGRRGHQGGGVRLEGAARAGDRAGGPLLIWQADTAQAGQIGQAAAVIVGAAAGQGRGRSRAGRWAKEKARAGGAVCALLLWLCFSAGVVVPGGGAARGGGGADRGQAAGTSPAAQFPPGTVPAGTVPGRHRSAGAILPFAGGVRFFT